MNNPPTKFIFDLTFENGHVAKAVRIGQDTVPELAAQMLGFDKVYPVIFISGGASNMSDEDREIVKDMMAAVAKFAEEHEAVVIDGGTESGVMKMIGDIRSQYKLTFPLIGVSPIGKVSFPGYKNPNEEAFLEDSHSHFALVVGEEWGDESETIMKFTNALSNRGEKPAVGVLVNGGKIAMHEIYLATKREDKISIIVLEGSGRAADEISTAYRTGKTNQAILQAILAGGNIELVGTSEGPDGLRRKLAQKFNVSSEK
jgi:hypothetical protein